MGTDYINTNKSQANMERRIKGQVIPLFTELYLRTAYRFSGDITDRENKWLLPLVSEDISDIGVRYNDKFYNMEELRRSIQKTLPGMQWWEALGRINFTVPGQVKNFLVIIGTLPSLEGTKDKLRILVKGSRALSTGGAWLESLARIVGSVWRQVECDMYDINEISDKGAIATQKGTFVYTRNAQMYEGDAADYDVAVDDAYDHGTVPWQPKAPYYSLKGSEPGVAPFLHPKESRFFSKPERKGDMESACNCQICDFLSSVTFSVEQFHQLRNECIFLGARPCVYDVSGDLLRKRDVYKAILAGGGIIENPGVAHIVEVLSREYPIQIQETKATFGTERIELGLNDIEHFKGRNLVFVGTEPSLFVGLGVTTIAKQRYTNRAQSRIDSLEMGGLSKNTRPLNSTKLTYSGDIVYVCREKRNVHAGMYQLLLPETEIEGYVATGYTLGKFHEYIVDRDLDKAMLVVSQMSGIKAGSFLPKNGQVLYESHVKYPPHARLLRPIPGSKENNCYIRVSNELLSENSSYVIDGRLWKPMVYDAGSNSFREDISVRADPVTRKIISAKGQKWIVVYDVGKGMTCSSNIIQGVAGPWKQDLYQGGLYYYDHVF